MPETGTVEFLKLYGILITNQKSDLVRNDLHTKLTSAPRVTVLKIGIDSYNALPIKKNIDFS